MSQLIAGNWKMHGLAGDATALARAIRRGAPGTDLLLCPPFVHLAMVAAILEGSEVALGAQDCHAANAGAHTGDIAAPMLRDLGCRFVILGHSERRAAHGETDALVRAKVVAALAAGLTPIVCVGESGADRRAGRERDVVCAEIAGSIPEDFRGVIAYEPIWAIGTGQTPSEEQVAAIHQMIRKYLIERFGRAGGAVRILYGGSVKPENARRLLALPEVGGALVGGASLKAPDFLAIAEAALA